MSTDNTANMKEESDGPNSAENTTDEESNGPNSAENTTGEESILINLTDQSGSAVFFKIKASTPMSRVFDTYSRKTGQSQRSIRFLYDGTQVGDSDTAKSLEMENNDIIDVVLQQTGG